jgi:hypothetical protein
MIRALIGCKFDFGILIFIPSLAGMHRRLYDGRMVGGI